MLLILKQIENIVSGQSTARDKNLCEQFENAKVNDADH